MRREIILDTETTGLDPGQGHRLVEIGCVEICNYIPTGRTFQIYINPERDMPAQAFAVHGLSEIFLKQFPPFAKVVQPFLDFIEDHPLVIHNASFDMKFIQAELVAIGLPTLVNPIIDTLMMARKKFPGAPASLDMLCKRFQINNTHRSKHGALLDAEILAQVYLELSGGRQPTLSLAQTSQSVQGRHLSITAQEQQVRRLKREPRSFLPTAEEREAHEALLASLGVASWGY